MVPGRLCSHFLSALLLILVLSSSAFSQGERKAIYGILIDNTGSLRTQIDVVLSLSKGIVERTHKQGPISVFPFKPQGGKNSRQALVALGVEWSQDKDILDKYIDSIFVVPGQTALIDGLETIAEQLNAKVSLDKDAFGEKVIFLVTDGEERTSKTSQKKLMQTLKAGGIKVYAVGLVNELENEGGLIRGPSREKAIAFLERITKVTGGRVVFAKSGKTDVEGLLNKLFAK